MLRVCPDFLIRDYPYIERRYENIQYLQRINTSHRGHSMLRILIADDHDVVRSGLRAIVEANPNWQVVGEAVDGRDAIGKSIEVRPDIAIIDYSLPFINGTEVTRQIRAHLPK